MTANVDTTPGRVRLGGSGISVRPLGVGLMGMSQFYGPADPQASVATIRAAIDHGVDFLDTSDYYGASSATPGRPVAGFGHNETLLGRALRGRRDGVIVATKFSARPTPAGTSVFRSAAAWGSRWCPTARSDAGC